MVAKNELTGVLLAILFGSGLVVGACGSARAASEGPVGTSGHASVIRDPDNPYWNGAQVNIGEPTQRAIHDPDNPYWSGHTSTETPYAEPVHGPR